MIRAYYLGIEVNVISPADKPGWYEVEWQDGKVYKHWWQDLKTEKYGDATAVKG